MQSKVASNQAIHHRSNANIKPPHIGMKSMDRIEQEKTENMSGQVNMLPPSSQQQHQPSYSTNTHVRQGKKVESSASHMMHNSSQDNAAKISGSKVQSSKSKKDIRPQSGGISQQKQFNKQSETRSRMQN